VNALSEMFEVRSVRDGHFARAVFENGVLKKEEKGEIDEPNGTLVKFRPSGKFFPDFHFDTKHILPRRMANYAWLNIGLALYFNGERYFSRRGLLDLLESKIGEQETLYPPMHFRNEHLEFAFTHLASFDESYFSFVNGQYTNDGGTHLSAFKEGLLKAVNDISQKRQEAVDVRDGIVAVVAVRIPDPIFESQTKNKLGNTDIRFDIVNQVKAAVAEALYKNPAMKAAILEKVAQNENVRKQIRAVKKGAKEQAQKTVLKIPKLRDCKYHLCDYDSKKKQEEKDKCAASMLFLTEGDSAAANMISARNPDYQAVFPLRGKPFNCQGKKKDTVYKNEELYFIMKSLGIEESLDDLRYGKIVIASDADVDGFHIRILLITFFLTFYQPLVLSDHLFILETPLFRVRNKKRNIYCYNERERAAAVSELGKGCEITRFKGLGEISPHEFGQFVDEGIRLQPVNIDNVKNIDSMLQFFMGDNTPERKDYIMRNCFFDLT
ncbi:MAG: type IIA DNA topoisomerase subunit B, partial [Victivallales bacterium]|nr:type IIA DNA topoisomerase subunit B [Victivallales bacterium]